MAAKRIGLCVVVTVALLVGCALFGTQEAIGAGEQSTLADETLFLQQGPGMLVYVLTKETGDAISAANLEITMRHVEMTPWEKITLKTTESGFHRIEFGGQIPIELTMRVTKPGYTPQGVLWNKDSSIPSEYTFQLKRGSVIGGRVIDEQGEPVEGAFIDLWTPWLKLDSPNEVRNAIFDSIQTDADGEWSTDIVPADLEKENIYMRVMSPGLRL